MLIELNGIFDYIQNVFDFLWSLSKEDELPTVMHYEESTVETATEKCKLYAQHFKAAFSDVDVSSSQVAEASRNTPLASIDFRFFLNNWRSRSWRFTKV